jgi:methyl-accepting chemotaxis protein
MPVIGYFLKVISGDDSGQTFPLSNGEHIIGRAPECDISLQLQGISKKHAKITVADRTVVIEDLGSSNGTFVNGIFVTRKNLAVGDKVVLPGIVFTLNIGVREEEVPLQATGTGGAASRIAASPLTSESPIDVNAPQRATSIRERVQFWFTKNVQPMLDKILRKYDWKTVVLATLLTFTLAIIGILSVRFVAVNTDAIRRESERRALILAHRLAELNTEGIQTGDQGKLDVEKTKNADDDVLNALVVSTDGRILAPLDRFGEGLADPNWLKAVRSEEGTKVPRIVDGSWLSVIVSYPIPKFDKQKGQNIVGAMAAVELAVDARTLHWTQSMNIVLTTALISLLFVLIGYVLIYRMTAQPFLDMNDEIDQVLKGNIPELRIPIRFTELETLVRSFNFLLNKVKAERKSTAVSSHNVGNRALMAVDVTADTSFKFAVENAAVPLLILRTNQTIALMSRVTEQTLMIPLSGVGRSILDCCEDQTVLGNILEADKEARSLNGLPFQLRFEAFGREYELEAVAAFDEMGDHQRTVMIFNEVRV